VECLSGGGKEVMGCFGVWVLPYLEQGGRSGWRRCFVIYAVGVNSWARLLWPYRCAFVMHEACLVGADGWCGVLLPWCCQGRASVVWRPSFGGRVFCTSSRLLLVSLCPGGGSCRSFWAVSLLLRLSWRMRVLVVVCLFLYCTRFLVMRRRVIWRERLMPRRS
jgi:hypothetical protein